MRRPDEDIEDGFPFEKPTSRPEPEPAQAASTGESKPYWTEARVLRWGSTALAIVLAVPFLWKLSNALDGYWSWSWVPWLVFVPVAAFAAYAWRQFFEAEEAAKRAERDAKQAAFRIQMRPQQGAENKNWG
jgi:hypothetical protein